MAATFWYRCVYSHISHSSVVVESVSIVVHTSHAWACLPCTEWPQLAPQVDAVHSGKTISNSPLRCEGSSRVDELIAKSKCPLTLLLCEDLQKRIPCPPFSRNCRLPCPRLVLVYSNSSPAVIDRVGTCFCFQRIILPLLH